MVSTGLEEYKRQKQQQQENKTNKQKLRQRWNLKIDKREKGMRKDWDYIVNFI